MSERITIHTIESKEFDIKPRGYDRDAVDAFLDEICDEIERMNSEQAMLRQQLREAQAAAAAVPQATQAVPLVKQPAEEKKPEPQPAPAEANSQILAMLEMAARVKDETIADAKGEAEKIIAEAQEKARETIGSLAEERDSLNGQVEALRQTVADYRSRFEALLQAQQEAMDKISDL